MELKFLNDTKILACFARSYDDHHSAEFNNVHLLTSIVRYSKDIDIDFFIYNMKKVDLSERLYLIRIDGRADLRKRQSPHFVDHIKHDEYLWEYILSMNNLLAFMNEEGRGMDDFVGVFEQLLGVVNVDEKEWAFGGLLNQNCLFIFEGLDWFSIYLMFRLKRIYVSGGSGVSRHIFNTVEMNLSKFLFLLDGKWDTKSIWSSYQDQRLRVKGKKEWELNNLNVMEESWSKMGNYQSFLSKDFLAKNEELNNFLLFNISMLDLGEAIINKQKENIKNKEEIDKIDKNLNNLEADTKRGSLDSLKEGLSKKDKRRIKKGKISEAELVSEKYLSTKESNELSLTNWKKKENEINEEIKDLLSRRAELLEKITEFFPNLKKYWSENLIIKGIHEQVVKYKVKNNGVIEYKASKIKRLWPKVDSGRGASLIKEPSQFKKRYFSTLTGARNLVSKGYQLNNRKISTTRSTKIQVSNILSIKKPNFNIDSPFCLKIINILNQEPLNNETQKKIESFLLNQGSLLIESRLKEEKDLNYNKINSVLLKELFPQLERVKKVLKNYRSNVNKLLSTTETEKKFKNLFSVLDNDDFIERIGGNILRIISNSGLINKNTIYTNMAIELGISIGDSYKIKRFKIYKADLKQQSKIKQSNIEQSKIEGSKIEQSNIEQSNIEQSKIEKEDNLIDIKNRSFKEYLDDMKEIEKDKKEESIFWNKDTNWFAIGSKLWEFLMDLDIIIIRVIKNGKVDKQTIIEIGKELKDKVGDTKLIELPYKIPMIVKPKEHGYNYKTNKNIFGGYLLNDETTVTNLIIKRRDLRSMSKIREKNVIFDMVNNLSSVGYKINQDVLNFVLEYGVQYKLILDPDKIHPLSKKSKLLKKERQELDSFLSRKGLESNIIGLAQIFVNVPEFFIPLRLDNRGRVYCVPDYLNYQSIDLAKSLLLFSKVEKISKVDHKAIEYLKIFGANCFGNKLEKKSFEARIEWVNLNEEEIINFRNGRLIEKAENKLLFIAFCFEYINYKNSLNNEKTYFLSHFPIQLDATCNGYQHLALLIGEQSLARELNISKSTSKDYPKDFYSFIGIRLQKYIKEKVVEIEKMENHEEKNLLENYKNLAELDIHRSLVKKPIMVKPYNASLYQIIQYVKQDFTLIEENKEDKIFNKDEKHYSKYTYKQKQNITLNELDFGILVKTLELVIYKEFMKIKDLNTYLKNLANICSKLNIGIPWLLPSGLSITQDYVKSEDIRLKPFRFKENTFTLKLPKLDTLHKAKQMRALMPNLIHSLDAASLALLADKLFKEKNLANFYSIHDCFAVTANNVEDLFTLLKSVYLSIYCEDNYLLKFEKTILNHIILQFGNKLIIKQEDKNFINYNGEKIEFPNIKDIVIHSIPPEDIKKSRYIIQ